MTLSQIHEALKKYIEPMRKTYHGCKREKNCELEKPMFGRHYRTSFDCIENFDGIHHNVMG